jgi:hypothetical protein
MNNEDFPALPRNQDSESSPDDRNTTTSSSSSEFTWITTQVILEGFSSPATPGRSNSESYSQLDNLRRGNRKLPRACPPTPAPTGETTTGNSETSASVNTSSNEDQDATGDQADDQSSALSGYSPGRSSDNSDFSSIGPFNWNSTSRKSSEEGSPNTPIDNERDNDNSPNPSKDNDEDNDEDNEEEPDIPTPSPSITTTAKMASFDTDLEHLVLDIMKYDLKHPLAIALEQAYITTFYEFRSIEVADVGDYTILDANTKDKSKLHINLVKAIQRGVSYARHLEDINDPDCDDPTRSDSKTYSKWTQNGYVT